MLTRSLPLLKSVFALAPKEKGNRSAWVDYAKGIAIILVVYRHSVNGLLNSGLEVSQAIINCNEIFYSFRMPLFFFLSGLFYYATLQKRGANNFVILKVNTLLYPYLMWAIIQVALQIYFSKYTNSQRSAEDFLNILGQPRALDQLWYLFALFNVSILYLFADVVMKVGKYWQILVGLVLLATANYLNSISTLYDIMIHYIFFVVGTLVSDQISKPEVQEALTSKKNLLILLPIFAGVQYYYLYHQDMSLYLFSVIALVGSLFTIMLSFRLAKTGKLGFLKVIGHYSLYIYLMHVMIIAVLRFALFRLGILNNETAPFALLFFIPASIFLSIIIYRVAITLHMGFFFKGNFKMLPQKAASHAN